MSHREGEREREMESAQPTKQKKQLQRTTRKTKNKAAAPRLVTKNTKTMISCHDRSINDAKQKKSKSRSDKVSNNTCSKNPSFLTATFLFESYFLLTVRSINFPSDMLTKEGAV